MKRNQREDTYLRGYLEEDDVCFYYHFKGETAIRQIEIYPDRVIKLSVQHPIVDDSFLCDQNLSDFEVDASSYISKEEFEDLWNN